MKKLLIPFFCFLLLSGCNQSQLKKNQAKNTQKKILYPPLGQPITIFIHGGAKPVSSMLRLPGFHDACPSGFYLLKELPYASRCLGRRVATSLCRHAPEEFPASAYYVYGWSAMLSFSDRERAGKELYDFITTLRAKPGYEQTPLTLLTYSHGGNVALAAGIAALEAGDKRTLVDLLVTMACPVVVPTDCFITSPIFKRVIALHSKSDAFQVIDPQGLYTSEPYPYVPLFSQRRFDQAPCLVQAEVKTNQRSSTGHLGFVTKRFMRCLPQILEALKDPEVRRFLPRDMHGSYCVNINTRDESVGPCALEQ